jgi:hypothetical protein
LWQRKGRSYRIINDLSLQNCHTCESRNDEHPKIEISHRIGRTFSVRVDSDLSCTVFSYNSPKGRLIEWAALKEKIFFMGISFPKRILMGSSRLHPILRRILRKRIL